MVMHTAIHNIMLGIIRGLPPSFTVHAVIILLTGECNAKPYTRQINHTHVNVPQSAACELYAIVCTKYFRKVLVSNASA